MFEENRDRQHPEADLLAAFAEHGLTKRERKDVLRHLADCARCRQIVFLAQDANPLQGRQRAPYRAASIGFLQRNWLSIAAPALAALTLIIVSVVWYEQFDRAKTSPATKAALVAAPPTPISTATPAPTAKASQSSSAPASPPRVSSPAARGQALSGIPSFFGQQQYVTGASHSLPPIPKLAPPDEEQMRRMEQARIAQEIREHPMEPAQSGATQSSLSAGSEAGTAIQQADAAGSNTSSAEPLPLKSRGAAMESALRNVAAMRPSGSAMLPDGKAIFDSVDLENRRLALNSDGMLYVSQDRGAHWRHISQQWSGKAITLMLLPTGAQPEADSQIPKSDSNRETTGAVTHPISASTNAVLLRNSDNAAWISIDGGETWRTFVGQK